MTEHLTRAKALLRLITALFFVFPSAACTAQTTPNGGNAVCAVLTGSNAVGGMLTLAYSGSGQGQGSVVRVARQASIELVLEKTPYGHWESRTLTGSASIHDSYTSSSLSERIEGSGEPLPEPAILRLSEDSCTVSARIVVSVEAQNSTIPARATSTVGVVYLEGIALSGEADLKAHHWYFGQAGSGVALGQGQAYVEGFAQELGMILGNETLGTAKVTWDFSPAG